MMAAVDRDRAHPGNVLLRATCYSHAAALTTGLPITLGCKLIPFTHITALADARMYIRTYEVRQLGIELDHEIDHEPFFPAASINNI